MINYVYLCFVSCWYIVSLWCCIVYPDCAGAYLMLISMICIYLVLDRHNITPGKSTIHVLLFERILPHDKQTMIVLLFYETVDR